MRGFAERKCHQRTPSKDRPADLITSRHDSRPLEWMKKGEAESKMILPVHDENWSSLAALRMK